MVSLITIKSFFFLKKLFIFHLLHFHFLFSLSWLESLLCHLLAEYLTLGKLLSSLGVKYHHCRLHTFEKNTRIYHVYGSQRRYTLARVIKQEKAIRQWVIHLFNHLKSIYWALLLLAKAWLDLGKYQWINRIERTRPFLHGVYR